MSESMKIRVRHAFTGFTLDVDLQLPGRGVTVLFGHSGSGKTTLLRCVAGLEHAEQAHIALQGECWQDEAGRFVPTWQRSLGYVFQEASLFPHLDVRGNLAFGMKRATGAVHEDEIRAMAARFGIEHLLARKPDGLSGGERQRVAIARALLTRPRLLLMDEPLSALDAARKQEILPYLESLHDELDIPVLYVTHQIEEAARLADHLVLMEQGRVLASGPLGETLARLDLPLARDHDAGVVIEAQVLDHEPAWQLTRLGFAGGELFVSQRPLAAGSPVRVRIVARDISIALSGDNASSIQNRFPCTLSGIAPAEDPAQCLVGLDAAGVPLLARITRRSAEQLGLLVGQKVWAQVKAVALLD
ncbi:MULTISPECIES: molybdenum ABC transporter ATP-binding protein [unclassified Uliginosibacterium]|uniref:molybdenum ABC transporter ATP-binding protein n=1 Tax=unclassified Uliginosibacterium TaxID=2621521 RepID=UPI000C7A52FE|nr:MULTISPECIES: molybdenum ABC transporter ATP-binding protein [unclassified Uliginosibacterium]MDO6388079.1 molybdenum ABC transporter ATP-binding protein [Uliginosibacterium sp. 31-12]PLK48214.1 molybdenum ABC transporter ATP-binding protein [Uliginosibacterium sp. TH139]